MRAYLLKEIRRYVPGIGWKPARRTETARPGPRTGKVDSKPPATHLHLQRRRNENHHPQTPPVGRWRNLNLMQRAELALKLKPLLAAQAKEKQAEGGKEKVVQNSSQPIDERKTRASLAKAAGVSHDTISKVEKIQKNAIPAVQQLAREGKIRAKETTLSRILPEVPPMAGQVALSGPPPIVQGTPGTRKPSDTLLASIEGYE